MAKRRIDEPTIEYAAGQGGYCLAVTPHLPECRCSESLRLPSADSFRAPRKTGTGCWDGRVSLLAFLRNPRLASVASCSSAVPAEQINSCLRCHGKSAGQGTEVARMRGLHSMPSEPVLLEKPRSLAAWVGQRCHVRRGDWYARFWNLDYFKRDCGHDYWRPGPIA